MMPCESSQIYQQYPSFISLDKEFFYDLECGLWSTRGTAPRAANSVATVLSCISKEYDRG